MAGKESQPKAVQFLVPWMGFDAGSVTSTLSPGVMSTLVTLGKAEAYREPRKRKPRKNEKPE